MSTKKSIVITHLTSKKHGNGKDKLKKSKLKDQMIMEAFRAGDRTQKDSTLPVTERAYRLEVVEEFGKIDMLRSLLEKNGQRLTVSAHLGQYISIVFKQEDERIKNELTLPGQTGMTRDVSIIFDGSIRQGEAIAQVLNQCLSLDYKVKANSLLAAMRDGASVNQAALDRIAFIFPKMLNVVCFSHTLDDVGNHLVILTHLEFGSVWIRLFRHS